MYLFVPLEDQCYRVKQPQSTLLFCIPQNGNKNGTTLFCTAIFYNYLINSIVYWSLYCSEIIFFLPYCVS